MRSTAVWSKWLYDRSAAASTSSPANSRWSTSKRKTAGTDIPFTIASAPKEEVLRVTVKALGDYTARLQELIEPGMPAVIGGPHGRFNHWKGTDQQIWIAGGVGVAPFLSWLRALDGQLPHPVDFYYSADGTPPFADEIRTIADRHPSLHAHLIDTSVDGRLTTERVLSAATATGANCPSSCAARKACCAAFQTQLRLAGVPQRQIHREYFDWR